MRGLAGNTHAYFTDITPQFCRSSSAHSQFKHRHCYALHFEYEHKPAFEEGQRLSTWLLDPVSSNDGTHAAAGKDLSHVPGLQLDDALKQLSKRATRSSVHRKLAPHLRAEKRRSGRFRVSQKVGTSSDESTANYYVEDSDLFSFDDVPTSEDDDDNVSMFEDDTQPSSLPGKNSGQFSRKGNGCASGTPCVQPEPKLSTLARVAREIPGDASNKHDDNSDLPSNSDVAYELEHPKLVELSMKRNADHQSCIQSSQAYQKTQFFSEPFSSLDVKIENDKWRAKLDYKGQWNGDSGNNNGSQDAVACASYEKGNFPLQQDSLANDVPSRPLGKAFNPLQFARTYNLVALRVSLAECESLATRLRGHLLNWPRVSNVARVEGDDMDWDSRKFWEVRKRGSNEDNQDSLLQAVYGTIAPPGHSMKRIKSAQKLSPLRFRFLERISRPGHKAVKETERERDGQVEFIEQNPKKFYMVQLGNSSRSRMQNEGFHLLGSSIDRWRGPFRLLLLDPKYARQSELPMAVQMLLNECRSQGKAGPRREIVPCILTLFYDYWPMEEILRHLLPTREMLPLPIRVLGHVAVLHLGEQCSSARYLIGKVILDKLRPRVKTVINRSEEVECWGQPMLEVLAGNHSVVTSIVENNMRFLVNLKTVHWDAELAVERQRLVQRFCTKDIVCDVCAGAGALALLSAEKVWRVFANDPIPNALKYLARNVDDNNMQARVELYNLDCCTFIRKLLLFKRPVLMTQIVFSLPTNAETVIDALKGAFNRETWPVNQPLPTVHVYGYGDTETDFGQAIVDRLRLAVEAVELHRVKTLASGRQLMCTSFQIPETLAFDD